MIEIVLLTGRCPFSPQSTAIVFTGLFLNVLSDKVRLTIPLFLIKMLSGSFVPEFETVLLAKVK